MSNLILSPDALSGVGVLADVYKTYLSVFPLEVAWPVLLAAASTLYPWKLSDTAKSDGKIVEDNACNLYCGVIGRAHCGKSSSIEQAASSVGLREEPQYLYGKWGSPEILFRELAELDKSPSVLINVDELGHLLYKSQIKGATFTKSLNSGFYKRHQKIGMAKGQKVTIDRWITLIGGLLPEEFGKAFGAETKDGFYDRFLFAVWPDNCPSLEYKSGWQSKTPAPLTPVLVHVPDEVWDTVNAWKKSHSDEFNRCGELALRAAIICASMDGRETLTVADLTPQFVLAEYQIEIRKQYKPSSALNPDAEACAKIKSVLKAAYPEAIPRWKLNKGCHWERTELGESIINRALHAVVNSGAVEVIGQDRPWPKGWLRLSDTEMGDPEETL